MKKSSKLLNLFVQTGLVIGMLAGVALIADIYVVEMPIIFDFFAQEGKPVCTLCFPGSSQRFASLAGNISRLRCFA